MAINKKPINEILNIIIEQKNDLTKSQQYQYISKVLKKESKDITYPEKLAMREALRTLCVVAGLSYDRLILKVYRK